MPVDADRVNRQIFSTFSGHNNIIIQRKALKTLPPTYKPMCFSLLNPRSAGNKTLTVKDITVDRDIDVVALTEAWLSKDTDEFIIRDLCPTGYISRGSCGGGIGILHKTVVRFKK